MHPIRLTHTALQAYERLTLPSKESRSELTARIHRDLLRARDLAADHPEATAAVTRNGGLALLLPTLRTDLDDGLVVITVPDEHAAGSYVATTMAPLRTFLRRGKLPSPGEEKLPAWNGDSEGAAKMRSELARRQQTGDALAYTLALNSGQVDAYLRGEDEPPVSFAVACHALYGVSPLAWTQPPRGA